MADQDIASCKAKFDDLRRFDTDAGVEWEIERRVALARARGETDAEYLARWRKEYVGSFDPEDDRDTRA